jgi:DHA1 family inner membrane transport protein
VDALGERPPGLARALRARLVAPAAALFLCLLAAQAGVLVLTPILLDVAADFDVSTALAGQVRTLTGLVAGLTALVLGRVAGRVPLRDLLAAGAILLAAGSALSAVAPSFAIFALAQVPTGVALAVLLSAGVAGASEWVAPGERARVLAWALAGQSASWIVGMPLVGLAAEVSWRLAFAIPTVAAAVAAVVVSLCRAGPPASAAAGVGLLALLRERRVAAWALGELLAFSAWAGTLVYVGALVIESHGTSLIATGFVLAFGAAAHLAGNFAARRLLEAGSRALLIRLALAAAVGVALLGTVRPSLAVTAAIFAALGIVNGGRTLAGSAFGLDAAPGRRLDVMGLRAAATQFGYLGGAALGGVALALQGYELLGAAFAVLFVAAALTQVAVRDGQHAPRAAAAARGGKAPGRFSRRGRSAGGSASDRRRTR